MNKIEVVEFLLDEIKEEQMLFDTYEKDAEQAKEKSKIESAKGGKLLYWWRYRRYKGRLPSKARIKNNCKKARQLLLDISKEI